MSMVVTVKTEIRDYSVLQRALEKMEMYVSKRHAYRWVLQNRDRGAYVGTVHTASGDPLCNIYKHGETYTLVAFSEETDDPVRINATKQQLHTRLDRIKQTYAVEEVMETAHREGWNTVRTCEEDGTIYLHLAV
jgi:hypothetical protein